MIRKIYFIHEGKAYYPAIAAHRAYFAGQYESAEMTFAEAQKRADLHEAICWHAMGFYPARLPAALTIHDYRSLSVGRFSKAKDLVKRVFNAKPDLRILKPNMEQSGFDFHDKIPTVIQDVGVPADITRYRRTGNAPYDFDFCYTGIISDERKSSLMLDSFIKRFGREKSFVLVGTPQDNIAERYKDYPNIQFRGRVTQQEVMQHLAQARVAVCYFPNHYPHTMQTPTKLLEAAGVGARVLANEQPYSRLKAAEYKINALWVPGEDMFGSIPATLDWTDNRDHDPTPYLWPTLISRSGIAGMIARLTALPKAP